MNRLYKMKAEKGQVLIIGIIAMLILLIAIFFLFDIRSIIRVKVQAQTAADAAALASVNWQRHSLNLIGELNLVKACTVLVETVFPGDPDLLKNTDPVKIEIAADIITEMQSRIAFVGPMIGFGAAQQAAKKNGINAVPHYNKIVSKHIELLSDDNFYGLDPALVPQTIPDPDVAGNDGGYRWRNMDGGGTGVIPYRDMIEAVLLDGIRAAPNADFASLPVFEDEWKWLMKLDLYSAIASEYWCYWDLREFVKAPRTNFWSGMEFSEDPSSSFPKECEYSPIYIDFSDASASDFSTPALEIEGKELLPSPVDPIAYYDPTNFPEIRWCTYESKWDNGPGDKWTSSSTVKGALYLRSPLKPEYRYGGAVAKMTCTIDSPAVQSSNYNVGKLKDPWISKSSVPQKAPITCSALAKPLGSLSGGNTPNSVRMVLPVFTKSVLIPIAMQNPTGLYDPFNEDQYNLFEFLKWIKDTPINDIGTALFTPPANYSVNSIPGCPNDFYLLCLQKLNTPSWTNRGFLLSDPPFDGSADYNKNVGWLQRVRDYGVHYDYGSNGEIIATNYINIITNEHTCDYPPPGSGTHDPEGPDILH